MRSIESKLLSNITPAAAKRLLIDGCLSIGSIIPFSGIPMALYTPNSSTGEFPLNPAQHPLLFGVAQRIGDFPYGWLMSSITYDALSLIPKIPERVRLGAAFAVSAGVVISVETSLTPYGVSDSWDIPAGLLGPVVHLGLNLWLKRKYREVTNDPLDMTNVQEAGKI